MVYLGRLPGMPRRATGASHGTPRGIPGGEAAASRRPGLWWGRFVMEHMTWMLRQAARLLPPERRPWAEALQAEAGQVPAGWPRLRWLVGGLVVVAREAHLARKLVYWLGLGAVATAAARAVIL